MDRALWAVIALISYGSLYPFAFESPASLLAAWNEFILDRHLWTSLGDVFGNILLFIPLGVIAMLPSKAGRTLRRRIVWTLTLGLVLAFVLQVLQIWIPSRSAALSDVFWNVVGTVAGMAVALGIGAGRRRYDFCLSIEQTWIAALVVAWLVVELAPFVPFLDWSGIKTNLKPLLINPSVAPVRLLFNGAAVLLLGQLLSSIRGSYSPNLMLIALLAIVNALRPFMVDYPMSLTTILGQFGGLAVWLSMSRYTASQRSTVVILALLTAYTVQALAPFAVQDTPATFHWLPFAAMLEGSMIANARALAESVLIFGGVLVLTYQHGGSAGGVAFGLAIWVGMIEVAQLWLPGHTSDITEPLLALAIGLALRMSRGVRRKASDTRAAAAVIHDASHSLSGATSLSENSAG